MTNASTIQRGDVLEIFPDLKEIEDKQERYKIYINKLSDKYKKDEELYSDQSEYLNGFNEETLKLLHKKSSNGFFYQVPMLFGRYMIINRRNFNVLFLKLVQAVFTAFLSAIIFINVIFIFNKAFPFLFWY